MIHSILKLSQSFNRVKRYTPREFPGLSTRHRRMRGRMNGAVYTTARCPSERASEPRAIFFKEISKKYLTKDYISIIIVEKI